MTMAGQVDVMSNFFVCMEFWRLLTDGSKK